LINGKGRYPGGPQNVSLSVVNVEHGKRLVHDVVLELKTSYRCHNSYRFRLVSISCDPSFLFSIDNHTMTVIEVEGTNVQPLPIDAVQLFAGARGSDPIICSINESRNRTTLLRCCKTLLLVFARDGTPYVFIGLCEPASVQLLYVFRLILMVRVNVDSLGIRALPNPELVGAFNFSGFNNVAVFRYRGAPDQFPPDPSQNVPVIKNPLIETNLHVG
jgi:multicopper oxidase